MGTPGTNGLKESYLEQKIGSLGEFTPRDQLVAASVQMTEARARENAQREAAALQEEVEALQEANKELRESNRSLFWRARLRGIAAGLMALLITGAVTAAGFTGYRPWNGQESRDRTMEDSVNTLMFNWDEERLWSASAEIGAQVEKAIQALRAIEASGDETADHARLTLQRIGKALEEK